MPEGMTLDEAIKDNEHLVRDLEACGQDRLAKSVQLGIEALKVVQLWNHKQLPQFKIHLPGETEE